MMQMAVPEADLTLDLTHRFHAPRDLVFEMWTDPEHLVQWWGPEGVHIPESEIDVRVGGKWRTVMRNKDGGDHIVSGVYKEITPPSKLVFTWGWEISGAREHQSTVTVEFIETQDGTIVNLHQALLTSQEDRDNHVSGWTSSLVCLEQALAKKSQAS